MSAAALQAIGISHTYAGVRALDGVSLDLEPATVTCLMGDNGAGKSTLVRILAGVMQPTSGWLAMTGARVTFADPRAARAHGVITVFQDLALVPLMSVWRNFVLGAEPQHTRARLALDVDAAREKTRAALRRFGLDLDIERPVSGLSGGERQILAIARAVDAGARVLILDEPTAALGLAQVQRVQSAVFAARQAGVAILVVTHNPQHALDMADHIIVLQQGRISATLAPAALDAAQLTRRIVEPAAKTP